MALFSNIKKTEDAGKSPAKRTGKAAAKNAEKNEASMKDLYKAGAPSVKKETGAAAITKRAGGSAYRILLKPLITEKVTVIGTLNQYGFEVAVRANKIQIAKAIEEVYGIKPVKVNIVPVKGKSLRYGKTRGRRKDRKKAYITLPKGKTISVYEGV